MNMIPLVRAIEPGIAQTVNLGLGRELQFLRSFASVEYGASLFGRKQQRG